MKKILFSISIIMLTSLSRAEKKPHYYFENTDFSFYWNKDKAFDYLEHDGELLLKEILISKIISEPEGGAIHDFLLELNENDHIVNILRKNGNDLQRISIHDVINREVVLAETSGRKALIISCPNCTVEEGGQVNLKYLHNGISMAYKNFKMNIVYRDNHWFLTTLNNERIHSLRLVSRKIFGRIIGIAEIRVNS